MYIYKHPKLSIKGSVNNGNLPVLEEWVEFHQTIAGSLVDLWWCLHSHGDQIPASNGYYDDKKMYIELVLL